MAFRLLVPIIFFIFSFPVFADSSSLRQILSHVISTHPDIKIAQYGKKQAELRLQSISGDHDWQLWSNYYYNKLNYDNNFTYVYRNQRQFNIGLKKSIWNIGTDLGVNYGVFKDEYQAAVPLNASLIPELGIYSSYLNVNFRIALANNFAGMQYQREYRSQQYFVTINSLIEGEKIETLLSKVGHDYVNWDTAIKANALAAEYMIDIELLKKYLMKGGKDDDRISYRFAGIYAKAIRINSQLKATLIAANRRLVEFSSIDLKLLSKPQIALPSVAVLSESLNPKTIVFDSLRTFRVSSVRKSELEHRILADENNLKPKMEFILATNLRGSSTSFADSQHNDSDRLSIQLRFTHPLENTRAKSLLNLSRMQKMELRDDTLSSRLRTQSIISSQYKQLSGYVATIKLAKKEIALAEDALQLELEAFKSGDIDISIYIRALQKRDRQKRKLIDITSSFQHLYIDYLSIIDKLWTGGKLGALI